MQRDFVAMAMNVCIHGHHLSWRLSSIFLKLFFLVTLDIPWSCLIAGRVSNPAVRACWPTTVEPKSSLCSHTTSSIPWLLICHFLVTKMLALWTHENFAALFRRAGPFVFQRWQSYCNRAPQIIELRIGTGCRWSTIPIFRDKKLCHSFWGKMQLKIRHTF